MTQKKQKVKKIQSAHRTGHKPSVDFRATARYSKMFGKGMMGNDWFAEMTVHEV